MGYLDAIKDGVEIVTVGKNYQYYCPKCCVCGKEMKSMSYISNLKYMCKECRIEHISLENVIGQDFEYDKKESKLNNAICRIGKVAKIEKYQKAINSVRKVLHKNNWFQSTEEIMVAIELVNEGYKVNHQVKIGNYIVDFVIADLKVIIEVDGTVFHPKSNIAKENFRDEYIKCLIGEEWNIIHISDKDINNTPKPPTEAEAVSSSDLSEPLKAKIMEWLAYKRERREAYKPTGLKSLLTEVKRHETESGTDAVVNLVGECMANGWRGIIWERLTRPPVTRSGTNPKIHSMPERAYDFEALERQLIKNG